MQGHDDHKGDTTVTTPSAKFVVAFVVLRGLCDLHFICIPLTGEITRYCSYTAFKNFRPTFLVTFII